MTDLPLPLFGFSNALPSSSSPPSSRSQCVPLLSLLDLFESTEPTFDSPSGAALVDLWFLILPSFNVPHFATYLVTSSPLSPGPTPSRFPNWSKFITRNLDC